MDIVSAAISVIVFVLLKIWKASKGGSLAFLYWAIAVTLFFIGYWANLLYVSFDYPISWVLPLTAAITGVYVSFGALWYGTDTKLFKFKRESVIKSKNTFILLVLISMIFIIILNSFEILIINIATIGRSIQLIFWLFALYFIWKITKESKFTLQWVLISLGTTFSIPKIIAFILISLGMNGIINTIQMISFLFEMGLWILGFFIYAKRAEII